MLFLITGCNSVTEPSKQITITFVVDGNQTAIQTSAGFSVQTSMDMAKIKVGPLDRVDPPTYTTLFENSTVTITRVKEEFEVSENIIPFDIQTVRNESLPENTRILIQPGENGSEQITYRKIIEDGKEISKTVFKSEIINTTTPEITMVGIQNPFSSIPINGKIAYLTGGNAWLMENTTGDRKPLIMSGDLDGYIFSLSNDGEWLLFSRKPKTDEKETINNLFVVNTKSEKPVPISLNVKNVIHHAAWMPGKSYRISISTVESRSTAPGWQANNDLSILTLSETGSVVDRKELIPTNSGGIYGWWGTDFYWSPDGKSLFYSRPDGIGQVDLENGYQTPVVSFTPYDSKSDWAWIPPVVWSPTSSILYAILPPPGQNSTENMITRFDLQGLLVDTNAAVDIIPNAGLFSYPIVSSESEDGRFNLAFLKAIFPDKSDTSNYQIWTMDRDGSNATLLFPKEGETGVKPQTIHWDPTNNDWISFINNGNLVLINTQNKSTIQVTGDGSINRIDWK